MARVKVLSELLEASGRGALCNAMSCIEVSCSQCPFDNEEEFEKLQNVIKTWSLVDDE
ncbi:hypothetical protein [Vibrio phage PJN101]|nr:hypothetical protein [Vibrio phage PJN101]